MPIALSLPAAAVLAAAAAAPLDEVPYFRTPAADADGRRVAFSYAGDIYVVPIDGGDAHPVITHPAHDAYPRWSPDGRRLAFTSWRTGGGDAYVIDLDAGGVIRLTYDDAPDVVESWSPDGRLIYFSSSRDDIPTNTDIFAVPAEGGPPYPVTRERYEEEYNAAASPDGQWIAFNGNDTTRQWWRKGPRIDDTPDIWIVRAGPDAGGYRRITESPAKDAWPMWAPDGAGFFFVSDEAGADDIWYEILDETGHGGGRRRVTAFADGRVAWPSIAARKGTIVFERAFGIWRLEPGGEAAPIAIRAIADVKEPIERRTFTRGATEFALSPDGKKVAFAVKGEVFAMAAEPGDDPAPPFRVTRTPARESCIAWFPDSKRIAYATERDGDPDIAVYDFSTGTERKLTEGPASDLFPAPGPDGKWCAYLRDGAGVRLVSPEGGDDRAFIEGLFPDDELQGVSPIAWSPDGRWVCALAMDARFFKNLVVREVGGGDAAPITFLPHIEGMGPAWSPDGRSIVFATGQYRTESQVFRVDLIPVPPEFREDKFEALFKRPPEEKKPREREEKGEEPEDEKEEPASDAPAARRGSVPEVKIVLEGIRDRANRIVPFAPHVDTACFAPDGETIAYLCAASGENQVWTASPKPGKGDRAKMLTSDKGAKRQPRFSPDGKSVWYLRDGRIFRVPAAGGAPREVPFRVEMEVDPAADRVAAFREAWRLLRDYFYDPSFRGLDWQAMRERYLPAAAGARTRVDLVAILDLLCGELATSHMGAQLSEDDDGGESGDLGIDLDPRALAEGRYRIERILADGPLARADADLREGDWILAVDGETLEGARTLERHLLGVRDRKVRIEIARDPEGAARRTVAVSPAAPNVARMLRYRRWVHHNEKIVEAKSGGRLGYVHIRNMTAPALDAFRLDLTPSLRHKEGVVIDIRYNSGGYVAPFVIDELLRRPAMRGSLRDRAESNATNLAGSYILEPPTIVLQNEQSLSNAEMFAETYRHLGLGKIVGTPSCGWVVWTWGRRLVDGTWLRLPRIAIRTLDGEDLDRASRKPDIAIDRPLGEGRAGIDRQLDRAVAELLAQIDAKREETAAAAPEETSPPEAARILTPVVLGTIDRIPPESEAARTARHRRVAERREGIPLIVHRGDSASAPENTLEAYAAAMDLGADGVEIDIRRSKDGVLYLFHDDTLERMTKGQGRVSDLTYFQLLELTPKTVFGRGTPETRPPTLAALLSLARERAMLLHLDVKEPGLQDEIIAMLDAADVWDHLVEVNAGNADRIRSHERVRLLSYKGWWPEGPYAEDPEAIRHFLDQEGDMAIAKDPRPAARALKKIIPLPAPIPESLRAMWSPDGIVRE
ncbi:MAG: PD40 domain-containing protein [Planctomycetes bacterium]|nr:PD40 domain-containing protein [Planctomycetota bacterium]